jgi:NAD(P)-dependent dehydrogenase (short-subunit alcohol dehydrogenase family)
MRRQGKGTIINTASFVALMGAATSQISYTASKGAVVAMSRELGVQFAREGIRVNALCPGPVSTPLLAYVTPAQPLAVFWLIVAGRGGRGRVPSSARKGLAR